MRSRTSRQIHARPRPSTRMTIPTAGLLIRMSIALCDEGIGPEDPADTDGAVLDEAVAVAGHLFYPHNLWVFGLIDDANPLHDPKTCDRCARMFTAPQFLGPDPTPD